jgi:elongator complex protein 1
MDSCTSVVIDGNTLNFTPFEKAIVPPPMYAASVKLDLPIRQVFFPNGKFITVSTVAQLSNGNLILLGGDGNQSDLVPGFTAPKVVAVAALSVPNDIDPSLIRSLVVVAEESAVVLQLAAVYPAASNQSNDRLIEIRVSLADDGQASAKIVGMHPLEGRVLRMISWSDGAPGALLQLRDGQLLEYEVSADDPGTVLPSPAESLLEPCPWMAALNDAMQFSDSGQIQKERLVVGMTHRSRLYCHDRLLCDAVSSFVLSPTHRFLSYATSAARCHLRFLPITDLLAFDPLMGLDENQLLEGFDARPIERGARLVALGASQPIAVLQMPRGNLEGLYPRALVLPFAISSIVREAYDEAFNLMRRQKVDLNLIVDVDPRRFLTEGVSRLLEQVTQIDHLNLFISCLHNWDTTKSKYSVSAWLPRLNQDEDDADGFDFAVKVNLVCSKLRSIMLRAEADGHTQGGRPVGDGHFLLPVLSTFAKEDPPKLKEALTLIKENAISKHPATSRKPPLFSERAQSSIQYLAFLANYDLLFETALGIYDFELARSIARNSQMDPKVYLPLIKRFQSLPECYARFQVDLRLKRYETALSNLFESAEQMENLEETSTAESPLVVDNSFETCLSFIDEHGLHSQGLRLFKKYPEKQRQVMLSLGNHLLQQQQSDTALAVFLAAKPPDYDGAKRAARMNGDWRFFFSLPVDLSDINDINSAADRRRLVAHEIAEELAERASGSQTRRQELANAARIFLDYSNDVGAAVDMFMNAEMWDEGFRVARLHSREDLAKKCVDAAIAYSHFLVADFEERLESFLTSHKRYGEVLKIRKQARGEEHYGESGEVAEETGSFFSAASNASIDSLRSNTSSASMGSVTSLSSVISVKSSSTFAFKGEHANRHKSKFSKNASEKKKSTKKKPKKGKIRPGSEEDLRSVVDTLKASFVESDYCALVASTISFICHVENMIDLAGDVYRTYCVMKNTVNDAQLARIESARQERIVEERRARKDGTAYETIVLPIETEVDALSCPDLPESLHRLFEYIS